jgi:glutathione S-transferase
MFLAEKGLSVELVDVPIAQGANLSPDHLDRHPLGLLPVLELDDGQLLRESMAICRYFEELHPAPNLFGETPWERAVVEQWNRHAEFELLVPIAQAFRNTHSFWQGRIAQSADFGATMKELALSRMTWFDQELASRRFVALDRFTIADITTLCALDFGKLSDLRVRGDAHPHLKRWYDAMYERPSARA